jgi:NitT/TauT family transport system substrate-binding protein
MASLKPLPKLIIIVGVVGAIGFGLNSWLSSKQGTVTTAAAPSSQPSTVKSFIDNTISGTKTSEPLGTKKNPLKVSIVSFHGYAPGLMANGGLKTEAGSINDRNGLAVEFLLQDDIPTLATLFASNTAHCAWRTSDFWAQEHPNLRNAKGDGKAVMVVDNTQGGDAVIARDPNIKSVEGLAGKSVALLQFTPSHGLLQDAIENSSLTPRQKQSIKMVFINADEGTGGVRAAYESGKVDAAVIWDPDLALALRSGGHVVYSTKQASNLIYDVMVCNTQVLNQPTGADAIQKFVSGWMDGVVQARANPDAAVNVLTKSEDLFRALVQQEGAGFVKGLFNNIKWTGLEDNIRVLGMSTEPNHYERVYKQFDQIYRTAGALANPTSPVINPSDSFDYRFIKNLAASAPAMVTSAAAPVVTFNQAGLTQAASKPAAVTKPVMVTFASGSSELSQRAKKQIDLEMVPFIENNGTAYMEISGNTDSVGSDAVNLPLSKARANAVMNYLVTQWAFPRSRFNAVGYGAARPICDERSGELPVEQCRELNRSTRVAVLGR